MIFAIDPGPQQSAFVLWNATHEKIFEKGTISNAELLKRVESEHLYQLVIEMVQSFGMPVGAEIFDTVVWIGRFAYAWERKAKKVEFVYRKDIKMHFCQSMRAKDSNIRQALIDRFGQPGIKKNPGKLYGVSKDIWSALACAVFYADNFEKQREFCVVSL